MSAALLVITLLAALLLPAPAAAAWRLPVPGPLERGFDVGGNPYAGGQHRGIDLRAAPGTTVRAPCEGRVVVAGRVGASGGVVTVLCGVWRVSLLPLATITARAGAPVARGAPVGTLARASTHAGLHLGVRRDGTRFGYVDPLRFLGTEPSSAPPLGPAPRGRAPRLPSSPPAATPPPITAPISAPAPINAPAPIRALGPTNAPAPPANPGGLAPWPAWAGLALVLAGAGVRWHGSSRTRTRRLARTGIRLNE